MFGLAKWFLSSAAGSLEGGASGLEAKATRIASKAVARDGAFRERIAKLQVEHAAALAEMNDQRDAAVEQAVLLKEQAEKAAVAIESLKSQ